MTFSISNRHIHYFRYLPIIKNSLQYSTNMKTLCVLLGGAALVLSGFAQQNFSRFSFCEPSQGTIAS